MEARINFPVVGSTFSAVKYISVLATALRFSPNRTWSEHKPELDLPAVVCESAVCFSHAVEVFSAPDGRTLAPSRFGKFNR